MRATSDTFLELLSPAGGRANRTKLDFLYCQLFLRKSHLLCPSAHPHSVDSMDHCRQENGPVCELPTETDLMARVCHYCHSEIHNEFDT